MSTMVALAVTEARLYTREWSMLVFAFVFPPMMMLILAGVFASDGPDPVYGGANGTDFYIASYLAIPLASVALTGLPVMLAAYRELGILRRFEASGISGLRVVLAQAAVCLAAEGVGALLVMATAAPVYGIPTVQNAGAVLVVLGFGAVMLLTWGIALGLATPTVRAANALGMLLFLPMFILGGGGPPSAVMPDTMRNIADALPLTHVTDGLREAWLQGGNPTSDLWVIAAWWAAGLAVVALLARGRRHG